MNLTDATRVRLCELIVNFGHKYRDIRIELNNGKAPFDPDHKFYAEFNLGSTGGSTLDDTEPALKDLVSNPALSGNALLSALISFRKSDCGPDLANIRFLDGQFRFCFLTQYSRRISLLLETLNEVILAKTAAHALRENASAVSTLGVFAGKTDNAPQASEPTSMAQESP